MYNLFINFIRKNIVIILIVFGIIYIYVVEIKPNYLNNNSDGYFVSSEIGLPPGIIVGMDSKWDKKSIHWVSIKQKNGKIIIIKNVEDEIWGALKIGIEIKE